MSLLTAVLGLWSADVGIDLGTANTLVHVRGRGIVLNEPSVVAVSKRTGQVLTVGTEARRMLGRTPADIAAIRPLRDGVIADFDHTEQMVRHFIARAHNRAWHISHPRVVVGIPSGVTEVEKRAVTDAATMAGAREAHLVEEPMAAAIGAGLPIQAASGSTLDATPPELVDDIMERGMLVCGGGALLAGLDRLFAHETLMPVRIAEDPLTCVVRGAGIVLEELDTLNRVLLRTRRARALRW